MAVLLGAYTSLWQLFNLKQVSGISEIGDYFTTFQTTPREWRMLRPFNVIQMLSAGMKQWLLCAVSSGGRSPSDGYSTATATRHPRLHYTYCHSHSTPHHTNSYCYTRPIPTPRARQRESRPQPRLGRSYGVCLVLAMGRASTERGGYNKPSRVRCANFQIPASHNYQRYSRQVCCLD